MKNLQYLVDRKLISKHEKVINGVKFCEYQMLRGMQQSYIGVCNKVTQGMQQSYTNNIEDNIKDNIKDNIHNNTALQIYREFFPNYKLTPYQQDLLLKQNLDADGWRKAVEFWASQGYQERKIGDIIDCYQKKSYLRKTKEQSHQKAPIRTGLLSDQLEPYTPQQRRIS